MLLSQCPFGTKSINYANELQNDEKRGLLLSQVHNATFGRPVPLRKLLITLLTLMILNWKWTLAKFYDHVMRSSCRFTKAAQMVMISSAVGISEMGKVPSMILKSFNLFIALSTCIRKFATDLFFWTFSLVICLFPCAPEGISRVAWCNIRSSWIGNPRSAISTSFDSISDKKPLLRTIWTSDARPPYAFERKEYGHLVWYLQEFSYYHFFL